MIPDLSTVKIFVRPGATDMRKQINGLSVIVQMEMKQNALNGSLYLFSGKNRKHLKILYWDKSGFCLWMKKLEVDRFPWPKDTRQAFEITGEELKMLLSGIDFFHAHKELCYTTVL
jgi:transposase